ncbi:LysM peptidoglycan-binding domain-containing protein [Modestobacter lapidis]|nr:LysM peptidoglycan-binding domain-containing protein [Modestobacter lapidis]
MTSVQLSGGPVGRSWTAPSRSRHPALPMRVGAARIGGPPAAAPVIARRTAVRPGGRAAGGAGVAVVRPVRGGCAGARRVGAADPGSAGRAEPAFPPLRLTRRGRRLVAGLAITTGIVIAVLVTATVLDGEAGGLRLAGDSSIVVRSGDTLWSIAVGLAPEEDTRAVVHAIAEVNDLEGTILVPGQVLQLP